MAMTLLSGKFNPEIQALLKKERGPAMFMYMNIGRDNSHVMIYIRGGRPFLN